MLTLDGFNLGVRLVSADPILGSDLVQQKETKGD